MSIMRVKKASLDSLAKTIREVSNSTDTLKFPSEWDEQIRRIPKEEAQLDETITKDGTYNYLPEEGTVWNGATITVRKDNLGGGTSDPVGIVVQKTIKENGEYEIVPDVEDALIAKVDLTVDVPTGGDTEAIEQIIDESGVLDNTEGTVEEKVEYLLRQMRTVLEMKSVTFGVNSSKTTRVDLNCKGIRSLNRTFYNCPSLTEAYLTNTQNVHDWSNTFYDNKLITIETLDVSNADKDIIGNANHNWIRTPTLQNLKIVSNTIKSSITFVWCSKLTAESIQSIIDGLAYVETAQTLTLNNAITLTDEQKAIINSKGWTLAQ